MTGQVLVTGGNGRLGQAVLQALGPRGIAGVRRAGVAGAILIDDGGRIDPADLNGVQAIINCAGRVTGSPAEVERANITYPATLAASARAAGVERFVQVSSFSVFGRIERIDPDSPVAPVTDYGRSKARAERTLLALDGPDLRVLPLRLPFMFSAEHPALMGRLVAMLRRARVLPVPAGRPVLRSMIPYAGAADALIALATMPDPPTDDLAAADPVPLDLRAVVQAVRARLGRVAMLPVPGVAVTLAGLVAPGLADRVFRSSVLAPAANTLGHAVAHSVRSELFAYLDRLAPGRSAGQDSGS